MKAVKLHISGRVQGVGFRPFIFRLAHALKLNGEVFNRPDGVIVYAQGPSQKLEMFKKRILSECPLAASIKNMDCEETSLKPYSSFSIANSKSSENIVTEICPDIAICDDCLRELHTDDRRNGYPFINCTNCGPRFTLIEGFPYDRAKTTMNAFTMCSQCMDEYQDPANRRFHAQPTSCFNCGPQYEYAYQGKVYDEFEAIIGLITLHINNGKVVALKGLGGYNLACDAYNSAAVQEIRDFKRRERKPFALMAKDAEAVQKIATLSKAACDVLNSWQRPIVILDKAKTNILPEAISSGLHSLGVLLPYLPLHYLLFEKLKTDMLVLTSGNASDSPILYQDILALEAFKSLSGGILTNNRQIARRIDDSVVQVISGEPRLMRRARGYVPAPIDLKFDASGVLAAGAELSNTFCIGKQHQAILSQHIGDLKNADTFSFYQENIHEFSRIYQFEAKKIACDLHPDYLSTQYAENTGLPVLKVQHHHAHLAAVMAEYNLNDPVLGLAYDGTGLGTDGHIWGSELLLADYTSFTRLGHFEYLPLPGGDIVTNEPWRTGLSMLFKVYGAAWHELPLAFVNGLDRQKAHLLTEAIRKGINTPLSCSAGRLFDAIAAITGVCNYSNYHAEAPLLLGNYLNEQVNDTYPWSGREVISFHSMIRQMVDDLLQKKSKEYIITKFHNTIAHAASEQVIEAGKQYNINNVVLSGGSFQNKFLTEKLVHLLEDQELKVYIPREVSCNDGGIALGQLAIAAHQKQ